MNALCISGFAILTILFAVSVILLISYRLEIKKITYELKFIRRNDTNMRLSQNIHFKETTHLIAELNDYISEQKAFCIKLENTNRMFKETITSISHDLRTPLTSASGYIQMANKPGVSDDKKKEYLSTVESRINAVNLLLNQLFEYARIESGEYSLSKAKINISNELCDAVSVFYDDFRSKNIIPEITISEEPLYILGDRDAVKRVFMNIINNAVKYGTGSFGIKTVKKSENIIISFFNETDKLSEHDVSRIFDRFYTSDLSRSKKSTGLGLAISKRFVNMMEGEISADYNDGIFKIEIRFKNYENK